MAEQKLNNLDYNVFISHSGEDLWVAKQIEKYVSSKGCKTFLDDDDIDIGEDFEGVILNELRKSDELLVLFTPWSRHRPYVWMEIGAAWGLGLEDYFRTTWSQSGRNFRGRLEPNTVKRTDSIELNNIDRFFMQLEERIKNHEKKTIKYICPIRLQTENLHSKFQKDCRNKELFFLQLSLGTSGMGTTLFYPRK